MTSPAIDTASEQVRSHAAHLERLRREYTSLSDAICKVKLAMENETDALRAAECELCAAAKAGL